MFENDDLMLSRSFKKFYIENLLDEISFQMDGDYPYDDEIFNSEELLEEF